MRFAAWIATAVGLSTAACVPQKQWRTQPVLTAKAPASAGGGVREEGYSIAPDASKNRLYSMAFVEFDNGGKLYDPKQLEEALKAIDEADRRSNHHALVITFIHGWKNNAGQSNNNVLDFRKQLNRIARDVCGAKAETCGVAGVYFGWNGDWVKREWGTLRQLSIFNRRSVARKVSAGEDVKKALLSVMTRVKQGRERAGNLSVMVGHSFGGLILGAATAAKLKELGDQLHAEVGKRRNIDADSLPLLDEVADLIVLINQAAPATEAVNLLAEFRQDLQQIHFLLPPREPGCAPTDTRQACKKLTRPLVLAVSSEGDLATRTMLPVSERLSPSRLTLNAGVQLPAGLDEKTVTQTGSAHIPALHSHHLVLCDGEDCSPCLARDKYYIPVNIRELPAFAPGNDTHKAKPLHYCLVRDFKAWNQTPYWIFRLPAPIVPDHGEIFTDRFTDFLTSFLPPLGQIPTMAAPLRAESK